MTVSPLYNTTQDCGYSAGQLGASKIRERLLQVPPLFEGQIGLSGGFLVQNLVIASESAYLASGNRGQPYIKRP